MSSKKDDGLKNKHIINKFDKNNKRSIRNNE